MISLPVHQAEGLKSLFLEEGMTMVPGGFEEFGCVHLTSLLLKQFIEF